jgi:hypothetical protein
MCWIIMEGNGWFSGYTTGIHMYHIRLLVHEPFLSIYQAYLTYYLLY